MLRAIQVYEKINADSLEELTARFDWSAMRMYNLNAPGQNHGILLGTKGWNLMNVLPNSALLTDAFSSLRCACGAAKRGR